MQICTHRYVYYILKNINIMLMTVKKAYCSFTSMSYDTKNLRPINGFFYRLVANYKNGRIVSLTD